MRLLNIVLDELLGVACLAIVGVWVGFWAYVAFTALLGVAK